MKADRQQGENPETTRTQRPTTPLETQNSPANFQAEFTTGEEAAAKKAARSFKKYSYRGVELDQLLDLSNEAFIDVSMRWGCATEHWTCL